MKKYKLLALTVTAAFALIIGIGCNGSGSSDSGDSATGTLSVYMTDAATDDLAAVYVTIDEVWVHMAGQDDSENET